MADYVRTPQDQKMIAALRKAADYDAVKRERDQALQQLEAFRTRNTYLEAAIAEHATRLESLTRKLAELVEHAEAQAAKSSQSSSSSSSSRSIPGES
jgi:predicted  nucleic acid-binding Zn-ribbon protein